MSFCLVEAPLKEGAFSKKEVVRVILKFVKSEDGQSLVEYTLIISLVALTAVGAFILFGQQMFTFYEDSKTKIIDSLGGK